MKKIFARVLAGLILVGGLVTTTPALALSCPAGTVRGDAGAEASSLAECNTPVDDSFWPVVNNVINIALGILGLITIFVIIYGGFLLVTSAGDASKVQKGKNAIMYGIIGLVIALLAFAIINFVFSILDQGTAANNNSEAESSSYIVRDLRA